MLANSLAPASRLSSTTAQVFRYLSESLAHTECVQSALPDNAILLHQVVATAFRAWREEAMLSPLIHEFCD